MKGLRFRENVLNLFSVQPPSRYMRQAFYLIPQTSLRSVLQEMKLQFDISISSFQTVSDDLMFC